MLIPPGGAELFFASGRCRGSFPGGLQPSSLRTKPGKGDQPPMVKGKLESRTHYAQAVGDTMAKIDGRCLFKVLGRAGDLADAKSEVHTLRQHLVVKHEVRRTFQQRQLGQDLSAERAIA